MKYLTTEQLSGRVETTRLAVAPDGIHFVRPMETLIDTLRCVVYVLLANCTEQLAIADLDVDFYNSLPDKDVLWPD